MSEWVTTHWNELLELVSRDWKTDQSLVRLLLLPILFSGFGAYFGAKMAALQRDREQRHTFRKESLHQLADISMMVGALCNTLLALKKQQVRDIANDFASNRLRVASHYGVPTVAKQLISFSFKLQSISCPPLDTAELTSAIVKFRDRGSGDLLQVSAIRQSCQNIERLIEKREAWIAEFKRNQSSLDDWTRLALYFGFPSGRGSIDQEYKDLIEGLSGSTDDAIFHSYQLHIRLSKQLVEMAASFEKTYRERFSFPILSFELSRDDGLFPDSEPYASWLAETPVVARKKWFGLKKWKSEVLSKIG